MKESNELDKQLLAEVLASEIASIATDYQSNEDFYHQVYDFMLKIYENSDNNTLQIVLNKLFK